MNSVKFAAPALALVLVVAAISFALREKEQAPPLPPSLAISPDAKSPSPSGDLGATLAAPKHYRPPAVSADLSARVDDFIERHRGMTKEEQEASPDFAALAESFMKSLDDPGFQEEASKALEAIKAAKGIEHGSMDIALDDLDSPQSRAFIEAGMSDDPRLARDYFLNLMNGAVFEFAFDPAATTTSEGLTVTPASASSSPAPPDRR
jgi:hypothetical protein